MLRDFEYESNNIGYNYQYTEEYGGGIKCKNFEVCSEILPKEWFEHNNSYLCEICNLLFSGWNSEKEDADCKGILIFKQHIECPICIEVKKGIIMANCLHSICIDCFKRSYWGTDIKKPHFPYPELEYEYYTDKYNLKWNTEYPLLKKYERFVKLFKIEWTHNYVNEEHLRKCPICRK